MPAFFSRSFGATRATSLSQSIARSLRTTVVTLSLDTAALGLENNVAHLGIARGECHRTVNKKPIGGVKFNICLFVASY